MTRIISGLVGRCVAWLALAILATAAGLFEATSASAAKVEAECSALAFNQLMRLLDRQAVVLAELRTRASIVLSAVGIVTALMGSEALNGSHPHVVGVVGVVVALLSLVFGLHRCIVVLWPVGRGEPSTTRLGRIMARLFKPESRDGLKWQVALDSTDLQRWRYLDDATLRSRIFEQLSTRPEQNYQTIDRRTEAFNEGCAALIVQVLAWSAALLFR